MSVLSSKISPTSAEYQANARENLALVEDLRRRLRAVYQGGGPAARERHAKRGKLFVRDRVDLLLDPDTPFLEFSPLAANGLYSDAVPGAGLVTGIGMVEGREVVIVANDATVKGGAYYPITVKKH
ncbi:MAG TPA: carboxyl transferase domain-containing protein, partial [Chloroflexota bacterium]|nr:carboxyl transferase domain-containing protein [Chloroflexota bacterium]